MCHQGRNPDSQQKGIARCLLYSNESECLQNKWPTEWRWMVKKIELRTELWVTPEEMGDGWDVTVFNWMKLLWLKRCDVNQSSGVPDKPLDASLWRRLEWKHDRKLQSDQGGYELINVRSLLKGHWLFWKGLWWCCEGMETRLELFIKVDFVIVNLKCNFFPRILERNGKLEIWKGY